MKALIVTGGDPPSRELLDEVMDRGMDLVIAADAGASVLLAQGIAFDLAVGDFDSLEPALLEEIRQDAEIITYQIRKDFTDTEAALNEAMARGAGEVIILGGTGTRLDHLFANVGLLRQGLRRGVTVRLIDDHNELFLIDGPCTVAPREGWYLSFFAPAGDVQDFSLSGVGYPLKGHRLTFGPSLTVSNEFTGQPAAIDFSSGIVLVVLSRD